MRPPLFWLSLPVAHACQRMLPRGAENLAKPSVRNG